MKPPVFWTNVFLYAENAPGVTWIALTLANALLRKTPKRYSTCCILAKTPFGLLIAIAGATHITLGFSKYLTMCLSASGMTSRLSASVDTINSPFAFSIPKFNAVNFPPFSFFLKTFTCDDWCFSASSYVLSRLPSSTTRISNFFLG